MKIIVTDLPKDPSSLATNLLGVCVANGKIATSFGRAIDNQLKGLLGRVIKREDMKGKIGDIRLIDTSSRIPAILLIGIGDVKKLDADALRKVSSKLIRSGKRIKAKTVTMEEVPLPKEMKPETLGQALSEGALLGDYAFTQYKSESTDNDSTKQKIQTFEILSSHRLAAGTGAKRGKVIGEVTNFARDLINTPATDMTPRRMADEARKIGRLPHLSAKILDRNQIKKLGMGCYLAVASGSTEPPYFIHLVYRPTGKVKKKIAVIGKGVTFDSGGLSLKTAQSMETMKDDMSGAAAMLGIMKALSALKPAIEVHGVSAVTENMPSGSADKPGDIARAMNGKTVEILNTDAEGRLTLADAIGYAQKQKPDLMIDIATLTGACVIALGDLCSAILGNNQKLINELISHGVEAGEKIWQLPLIEEYKEELKSPIADLKNVGGRGGGCINGGLFLQEFVDPKVPWAHIDIAGPSWTEKELDYCARGGTGFGVRTVLGYLLKNSI